MFRDAVGVLVAIAEQEWIRFSEWIKAGQVQSSKAPSRPALADTVIAELRLLREEGLIFKKIELATRVPVATMHKYLVVDEKTVLL